MSLSFEDQRAFDIVRKLFKNDYGEPFEMTEGQISLFRAIYEKQYPRLQFDCYTQYGKSDVVSMAVLLRTTTFGEKWIVLGATKDKASIITDKLIKHVFENDYTLGKFEIGQDETLERIRRERRKDHMTFRVDDTGAIGSVIAMSADARRKSKDAGDILIGHGAQNLIEDDAALIRDDIHGKALRMLGGHANRDSFLLKITNSFGRNHALRSAQDSDNPIGTGLPKEKWPANPLFHRIVIDYEQGLREGRLNPEFIKEMETILDPVMFGILYKCVYPPSEMAEDGEWLPLLTEEQVDAAILRAKTIQSKGLKRMALDVAEGINYNSLVIRTDNIARVKEKTLETDLMKNAERFTVVITDERIDPRMSWIDTVGIGSGVYSRVRQLGVLVTGYKGGESPPEKTPTQMAADPTEFYNMRAYTFWETRKWVLEGGGLEDHKDWKQLTKIRYRTTSDKKIVVMSKQEMRARALLSATESTDTPDALAMTFAPNGMIQYVQPQQSAPGPVYYPEIEGVPIVAQVPQAVPVGQSKPLNSDRF